MQFLLRQFIHFDSVLTSNFKKSTFTFTFNAMGMTELKKTMFFNRNDIFYKFEEIEILLITPDGDLVHFLSKPYSRNRFFLSLFFDLFFQILIDSGYT